MTNGPVYYRSTCQDAPSRSWPYKAIWSELRALWSGYVCSYNTAYRALLSEYRALLSEYRESEGVYDAVEPLVMFWQCHRRTCNVTGEHDEGLHRVI